MSSGRTVKGPRTDLMSVRGAADVRRLEVRGPGIDSLEGIERFENLVGLSLEKVDGPDLGRLRALSRIQQLVLDEITGPVDVAAIRELPDLEMLQVFTRDRSVAEAIGQLDLGGLPKLGYVVLQYMGPPPYVRVREDWTERAPALYHLNWSGFVFGDDQVERVSALASRLAQFAFTPASPRQKARIMKAFPPDVVIAVDGDADVLREPREVRPGEWEIGLLLADEWDTETTWAALAWLEQELERRDAALAGRVRMEEDADMVYVTAADRSDLEAVERIAVETSPPPRGWDPG